MKLKSLYNSFHTITCYIIISCLLCACGSSNKADTDYLYFQNNPEVMLAQQKEMQIRPSDKIAILVYSKTLAPEQAAIFNMPGGSAASGYLVSKEGYIDFPVIGNLKVAGLTKTQLQTFLEQKITSYVKNPAVLITFLEFNINILGEVKSPGTKKFTTDKVTIIDALGTAGDLTDFGKRQNILVIREENGKKVFHTVDLRNTSVFQSPVYIMQPNDIIYVTPNKIRLKQLNVDPEKQRKLNLILSLTSTGLGLLAIIFSLLR